MMTEQLTGHDWYVQRKYERDILDAKCALTGENWKKLL